MKYNKELANLENVKILGYEADIKSIGETLDKVNSLKEENNDNGLIQLMDAKAIAGKKHLEHGIIHAIKSFERGENLAKDLGIEILLRTSGQRQISKAFNILGLKEGKMEIAIVMIDCLNETVDSLNDIFIRNDAVLESDYSILKEIYDIEEKELSNIQMIDGILIDKTTKLIVDN
ncbi:MAG: KEOPS complex subunit Cgi121 [Methanobacteriaceae archaeon]|nr:KEOPS complex subunit Cgi121 [Methanobacteriaceae archaeon]